MSLLEPRTHSDVTHLSAHLQLQCQSLRFPQQTQPATCIKVLRALTKENPALPGGSFETDSVAAFYMNCVVTAKKQTQSSY